MLKHSILYIPKYLETFCAAEAKGLVLKYLLKTVLQDPKFYIRTLNVGFQSLMMEISNIGMRSKN